MYKNLFVLLMLVSGCLSAAEKPMAGKFDDSFNRADPGFGVGDGADNDVYDMDIQKDGKVVVVGKFTKYNGIKCRLICRLNKDGTLDKTFNPEDIKYPEIRKVKIQRDGKILIVGRSSITRLNQNGAIDGGFFSGAGAGTNEINVIALMDDGTILVGGDFETYSDHPAKYLVRLKKNGVIDESFNPNIEKAVLAIAVQPDGKALVGGSYFDKGLVRLNKDGSEDELFHVDEYIFQKITSINFQLKDKIVVGGESRKTKKPSGCRAGLIRLNMDGSSDTLFQEKCTGESPLVDVSANNYLTIHAGRLERLAPDGSEDLDFNSGKGFQGWVPKIYALHSDKNHRIYVATNTTYYNGNLVRGIARLLPNGDFDPSFDKGGGANNDVRKIAIQSNGNIIISGYFRKFNGKKTSGLARLKKNGELDESFSLNLQSHDNEVFALPQGDNKILVRGRFQTDDKKELGCIFRLNPDGSVDDTFKYTLESCPEFFILQSDGRILVPGQDVGFIRLYQDGSKDDSFNVGAGANDKIYAAAIQSDGKIVIGGQFTKYNGFTASKLARVNIDGSFDASFDVGTGPNLYIKDINISPDGSVYICGPFEIFNGAKIKTIARLQSNGMLDLNFTPDKSIWSVNSAAIQADGKLLFFGGFKTGARSSIARLNLDGSLDASFNSGSGPEGFGNDIFSIAITPDGYALIGGQFVSYDGFGANRIARLFTK